MFFFSSLLFARYDEAGVSKERIVAAHGDFSAAHGIDSKKKVGIK